MTILPPVAVSDVQDCALKKATSQEDILSRAVDELVTQLAIANAERQEVNELALIMRGPNASRCSCALEQMLIKTYSLRKLQRCEMLR